MANLTFLRVVFFKTGAPKFLYLTLPVRCFVTANPVAAMNIELQLVANTLLTMMYLPDQTMNVYTERIEKYNGGKTPSIEQCNTSKTTKLILLVSLLITISSKLLN